MKVTQQIAELRHSERSRTALITYLILFLASCANIVPPGGGPKDTTPPKVAHEAPTNFSKRFTGNTFTLEFDEYIQLNNPSQEIVVSPAIDPEPEFTVKGGKKLIVKWKGTLDSATTYTIAFGEAIKDAHEGNTLSGFKYVFSTGDEIDSLFVKGKIVNAKDNKPSAKVLVMLYKDLSDSIVIKKKPFYFTKTDEGGNFSLENIKAGGYKIFALKDENFNYLYDLPNEEIAFSDMLVQVSDSIEKINLPLFKENRRIALKMVSKNDNKNEYIKLIFSARVSDLEVLSLEDHAPVGIREANATGDSITIWYTRVWTGDSLIVRADTLAPDTIRVRTKPESLESFKENLPKLSLLSKRADYGPTDSLSVLLNRPVMLEQLENVVLMQDSPAIKLDYKFIRFADSTRRKIEFDLARTPGTAYTVFFPPGTFADYFGTISDSLEWKFLIKKPDELGSLKLTVTGTDGKNYIVQLLDNNEVAAIEKSFTGSATFTFENMHPASYQPLIIFDANGNGKWDTGDYLKHIQPEETYRHNEPVVLRANWEVEAELKVK